jgi:hypothetical protein
MSVKHHIFTTAQVVKALYTIVLTTALMYNIFKYGVRKHGQPNLPGGSRRHQ